MKKESKENFERIGSWSNIEVTKWFNENDKISYSIKLSYKKNKEWSSKTLTIFPTEVLDLVKAMELIDRDLF